MTTNVISVDVGNSSIGVGRWERGSVQVRRVREPDEAAALIVGPAALISVSPPRLSRLLDALARIGVAPPQVLSREALALDDQAVAGQADRPALIRVHRPELLASVGADRLANVLAVGAGPAIAIDAGTAVTVDLLDADGVYRGGFIAAGPRAAAAGLALATALLPRLAGVRVPLRPGTVTESAVAAGVWGAAVGGVDRLVDCGLAELQARSGSRPTLFATGGWADAWISESRHTDIRHVPDLVHHGIARWAGWDP